MLRLRNVLLVAAALTPGVAWAQQVSSPADLPRLLNEGDTVRVKDTAGRTWQGRVTTLTPSEFEVTVDGRRVVFQPLDLREVAVEGDSLVNGTLIGLGIGGTLGFLWGGTFSGGFGGFRGSDAVQGALILGGIGAGLGVGLDALIRGERVVYRAAPSVRLVPFATAGGFGLAAGLGW